MGMPQPTNYAGPVGQYVNPATGQLTTQGQARMDNPLLGFDTGGIGGVLKGFHGSPHAFDRFSNEAIGSGEGAQAYGHGHYLADAEDVARSYRDQLAARVNPEEFRKLNMDDAWVNAAETMQKTHSPDEIKTVLKQAYPSITDAQANMAVQASNPGHMYEVNVNAEPEHFLDWDKPLSEQHPVVQQNLADIVRYQQVPLKNNAGGETTGGQLYDYLQRRFNNDSHIAAQELHGEGIPGIRYLDAGSRVPAGQTARDIAQINQTISGRQQNIADLQAELAANQNNPNVLPMFFQRRQADIAGHQRVIDQLQQQALALQRGDHLSRNTVVFDPATMEVLRRYGLAGLMAGGGAAALGGQQRQQQQ
jgi:hypothetical protein